MFPECGGPTRAGSPADVSPLMFGAPPMSRGGSIHVPTSQMGTWGSEGHSQDWTAATGEAWSAWGLCAAPGPLASHWCHFKLSRGRTQKAKVTGDVSFNNVLCYFTFRKSPFNRKPLRKSPVSYLVGFLFWTKSWGPSVCFTSTAHLAGTSHLSRAQWPLWPWPPCCLVRAAPPRLWGCFSRV